MTTFTFLNEKGQKQGPYTVEQLKALVSVGMIKPETQLETDKGQKGLARQIKGLFESESPESFAGVAEKSGTASSTIPYGVVLIVCVTLLVGIFGSILLLKKGDVSKEAAQEAPATAKELTIAEKQKLFEMQKEVDEFFRVFDSMKDSMKLEYDPSINTEVALKYAERPDLHLWDDMELLNAESYLDRKGTGMHLLEDYAYMESVVSELIQEKVKQKSSRTDIRETIKAYEERYNVTQAKYKYLLEPIRAEQKRRRTQSFDETTRLQIQQRQLQQGR